jgi:hypothetical protein
LGNCGRKHPIDRGYALVFGQQRPITPQHQTSFNASFAQVRQQVQQEVLGTGAVGVVTDE